LIRIGAWRKERKMETQNNEIYKKGYVMPATEEIELYTRYSVLEGSNEEIGGGGI